MTSKFLNFVKKLPDKFDPISDTLFQSLRHHLGTKVSKNFTKPITNLQTTPSSTAMKNSQNDNYGKNVREEHFQLEIISFQKW